MTAEDSDRFCEMLKGVLRGAVGDGQAVHLGCRREADPVGVQIVISIGSFVEDARADPELNDRRPWAEFAR